MTEIFELAELFGAATKIKDKMTGNDAGKKDTATDLMRLMGRAETISSQARRSIRQYPVIFSAAMQDMKVVHEITKHLEAQYAGFIILASGALPSVTGSANLQSHLNQIISSESGPTLSTEGRGLGTEMMKAAEKAGEFKPYQFKDEKPGYIGLEGALDQPSVLAIGGPASPASSGNTGGASGASVPGGGNNNPPKEAFVPIDVKSGFDRMGKDNPTIITVKLELGGTIYSIPIGVKAMTHVISTDEIRNLFNYAFEKRHPLHRIIQLTSGEIKFVRDFILNMDRIERDKELYKKFGTNPWFQKLMLKKSKRVLSIAFKEATANKNIMPMCTVVCTKDEFITAAKVRYSVAMQNPKIMQNIMDALFLLGIAIYDPDLESITFHYSGFDAPLLYPISALKKSGDDKNDAMKIIGDLVKKL